MNPWQLVRTRCQLAIPELEEFKKLVYDSKFKKRADGMSFVNSKLATFWGLGKQDYGGSSERQSFSLVPETLFLVMTLDEFQALSEPDQLAAVYAAGTFVSRRWQEVDEAVLLYRMPGDFFAELTYNTAHRQVRYPDSFGDDEPDKLEYYAMFVRLPGWLPETEE